MSLRVIIHQFDDFIFSFAFPTGTVTTSATHLANQHYGKSFQVQNQSINFKITIFIICAQIFVSEELRDTVMSATQLQLHQEQILHHLDYRKHI